MLIISMEMALNHQVLIISMEMALNHRVLIISMEMALNGFESDLGPGAYQQVDRC